MGSTLLVRKRSNRVLGMVFAMKFRSKRKGSAGKTGVVSVILNTFKKTSHIAKIQKCYKFRSERRSFFEG